MKRLGHLPVMLSAGLIAAACAPIPTKEAAVIHVENTRSFPFMLLDFGSVELSILELDGMRLLRIWAELTPGRHSITVEARKGPTGLFGVAPFLGTCRGKFEVEAEAGRSLGVRLRREKESEVLQLVDRTTGAVLLRTPCVAI